MMRSIEIVVENGDVEALKKEIIAVQENAYRDGIDQAISTIRMFKQSEIMINGDNTERTQLLDAVIDSLPALYQGVGVPKEVEDVVEEPPMSEREALYREYGDDE